MIKIQTLKGNFLVVVGCRLSNIKIKIMKNPTTEVKTIA